MRKIIIMLFLAFSILTTQPLHAEAPLKPKTPQISELVALYADKYNISEKTLNSIIACESQGKINAINYNDGGKGKHSVGVLQFQKSTFDHWEKNLGEDLDYYSYNDQIKLGSYMLSKGQIKQWTCGRKLLT